MVGENVLKPRPKRSFYFSRARRFLNNLTPEKRSRLSRRELTVLRLRQKHTLEKTGRKLGVTREEIRRIEAKAFSVVRQYVLETSGYQRCLKREGVEAKEIKRITKGMRNLWKPVSKPYAAGRVLDAHSRNALLGFFNLSMRDYPYLRGLLSADATRRGAIEVLKHPVFVTHLTVQRNFGKKSFKRYVKLASGL